MLEIGSRDVNGGVRGLFRRRQPLSYTGIDVKPGPGVNYVSDGAAFSSATRFDLIICCEVFEHDADEGDGIVPNVAHNLIAPGGWFIFTCAGPKRQPHSGIDGGPLWVGEPYANPDPRRLLLTCLLAGFRPFEFVVTRDELDLYGAMFKP